MHPQQQKKKKDEDVQDESIFLRCECGALIGKDDENCWSCGNPIQKSDKGNKNQPSDKSNEDISYNIDADTLDLLSQVDYSNFIICPKCGANNQNIEDVYTCWSCGQEIKKRPQPKKNQKTKSKKKPGTVSKLTVNGSAKPMVKYVLHCKKCNAWYVSNFFNKNMKCYKCEKKKTVRISYTCDKCNKFFDFKELGQKLCPKCGKKLSLTEDTMLY